MRTAPVILGARPVSPAIRGELEVRSPSVSASDNLGHAANSFRAKHTNSESATVTYATRTESLATCYIHPLKDVLPPSDGVLYVFYDFETMQNTRYSDTAKVHIPNLVCIQ